MIWGITLVAIVIGLAITLLLISHSKQIKIQDAPPKLPDAANPSDKLPPPRTGEHISIKTQHPLKLPLLESNFDSIPNQ